MLHVVQNLNYGGLERLMFEMLRRSDRDQFENFVLALQYVGRFGEGMSEFATVVVAKPQSRFSLLYPRSLAHDIATIGPDVVHTHTGVWPKGSRAARMAGVPWLVHTEHGRRFPDPWDDRFFDGLGAARTDVIVAVSEPVAKLLTKGVTKHPERVHVVPNGVDVDVFQPEKEDGVLRAELRLAPDVPIIGSIGRLEPVKGYEVMVDAFARLIQREINGVRPALVVAGDGSERAALESRAAAAGVADRVHWLGWRDDMHRLHAAFTIFTMSSHSEGTSVSLLEA
ncbi:MAG TPA: glycosyltransferase, partial [Gemmatimonadaceae bacterium]|nr:glycosyltransferase [Gemmatimonadaceae bacterium]